MNVKGMDTRYTYTDNNLGIKINDYTKIKQKLKNEYNVKFTLPERDTYYSTDKFMGSPLTYAWQLLGSNVAKPINPSYKISTIEGSNQIDFRSDEWIKLGQYNGVTVNFRGNKYGEGVDSNLEIPEELSSKPGEPENEFEKKVMEMFRKIPDSQLEEIGNIKGAFYGFLRVAADEDSIQNMLDTQHKYLIIGLEKMGVDLSKPFALNGEEFYLRNDTGKIDYYNKKKFVTNNNGKVEIMDAKSEDPSDVWKNISNQIDIQNATFDELESISMKLYNAGQISGFECAMLTFDPSKSPQALKPDICLTQTNVDGRRDWIAEYKARSERDLQTNDLQSYEYNQRILEILGKSI